MKRTVLFFAITIPLYLSAQKNVGIGIQAPANILHVHDSEVFTTPPPFQLQYGNENYLQVTNGVTGTSSISGLRLGVNTFGGGIIRSPGSLEVLAGETHVDGPARLHMFSNVVAVDSNLWLSGNLNLPKLAGAEDMNLVVGPDGYLKTGLSGADTDWSESASAVYNTSKNIGIGVVAPSAPLMVFGPANDGTNSTIKVLNLVTSGVPPLEITSSHTMQIDGNSLDVSAGGVYSPVLTLQQTSGGNIEMVEGGGNVGIGTSAANRKVTINGPEIPVTQNLINSLATLSISNTDQGFSEMVLDGNEIHTIDESLFINSKSGHDVIIASGGGDVGLGTDPEPGFRLSVAGKIISEGVRCKLQTNWPDYVFENHYQLMSLEELKKSIKQNGHLPGIPSASHVARDGIDVIDMQVRMLEKIEELTLHIIQLNERMREVENENNTNNTP